MKALLFGIVIIGLAVIAVLPSGLGWWVNVFAFLRGALPVLACFIGLVSIFIGIADIKDRAELKKEKSLEKKAQ